MEHNEVINKQSIGEKVLLVLRERIMTGKLKSGTHLKEAVLSKELGVSRGPIREAITKLESEGLVTTHSNGRTSVEGFSEKDLENLYHTRIKIEVYAVVQLTTEAVQSGLPDLYDCVHAMNEGQKRGFRDVDSDLQFHYQLIKMTGNKTLMQLWKSLNGLIRTIINVTTDYTVHQEEVIHDHYLIVEYLEKSDFENASVQLEKHLQEALLFYKDATKSMREDEIE